MHAIKIINQGVGVINIGLSQCKPLEQSEQGGFAKITFACVKFSEL